VTVVSPIPIGKKILRKRG